MKTELIYLKDMQLLESEAKVIDLFKDQDRDIVILDKTIFYPQGGGQPYDQGKLISPNAEFLVEEVRLVDDQVRHSGKFLKGTFTKSELVNCLVDKERRQLLSRIHSAGHLLDMAAKNLNLSWIPGKGYHFPQGPYVEYSGSLDNMDKEKLKKDLENLCNQLIKNNIPTKVLFVNNKEELKKFCDVIPDYITEDQPIRVVMFGDFAVPCGGTHVMNSTEIKNMTIRKIKIERDNIRVGYDVAK